MKLYKILVNGKSCHGGDMEWSLPKKKGGKWVPGDWHTIDGDIEICNRGLHLTRSPQKWLKIGCTIYLAEAKDVVDEKDDKVVVRSARLLRPVQNPKWWDAASHFIEKEIPRIPYFKPDGKPKKDWRVFPNRHSAWGALDAYQDISQDAAMDAAWNAVRDAAWDAARGAAWYAAWSTAWNAALDDANEAALSFVPSAARNDDWSSAALDAAIDASLFVITEYICQGTGLYEKHREHAIKRMEVWRKGYGLLCDVDGEFFVYERP